VGICCLIDFPLGGTTILRAWCSWGSLERAERMRGRGSKKVPAVANSLQPMPLLSPVGVVVSALCCLPHTTAPSNPTNTLFLSCSTRHYARSGMMLCVHAVGGPPFSIVACCLWRVSVSVCAVCVSCVSAWARLFSSVRESPVAEHRSWQPATCNLQYYLLPAYLQLRHTSDTTERPLLCTSYRHDERRS
jgi:hypothetical protein